MPLVDRGNYGLTESLLLLAETRERESRVKNYKQAEEEVKREEGRVILVTASPK